MMFSLVIMLVPVKSEIIVFWYTEASEVCNTALENVISSTAVCPIPLEDLLWEKLDFRFINFWFISSFLHKYSSYTVLSVLYLFVCSNLQICPLLYWFLGLFLWQHLHINIIHITPGINMCSIEPCSTK